MILSGEGSENSVLGSEDLKRSLYRALDKLGKKRNVMAIPPDITRLHSRAGELTVMIRDYYKDNLKDILPALGTHSPMTVDETALMFPGIPPSLFRAHNFRKDVVTLGSIPPSHVSEITSGAVAMPLPVQVNRLVAEGGHDLVISLGQVVPHEVAGMAGYNKNILVGTGGQETINLSHYTGAVCGMEKIMGKPHNPVRRLLNDAAAMYLSEIPLLYVQTVIGRDISGKLVTRGLFIGDDEDVFRLAAELSARVNITILDKPLKKAVVWLDPSEYRSTWLGNKSIYRTRMAMEDGAGLIVLAPGIKTFGEDGEIDRMIRKFGYKGTDAVLKFVDEDMELRSSLATAAHLIHGSTGGRFSVTYCPGKLTKNEVEAAGFGFGNLAAMMKKYDPAKLSEGFNMLPDGEEIYFISNPATGLWSTVNKLK